MVASSIQSIRENWYQSHPAPQSRNKFAPPVSYSLMTRGPRMDTMNTTAYQLADEISEQTPRPARFTARSQMARVACALVTAGVFILISWLGLRDIHDLRALRAQGRTMGALITDKTIRHGKHDTYYLNYQFYVNRTQVIDKAAFDYRTWDAAVIGGSVKVTYLPSDPRTYRVGVVTDARIDKQAQAWFLAALAALCFVGLFAGAVEWTLQEQLALMRDGVAVAGSVMGRETVHSTDPRYKNAMPACYVFYTLPIGPAGRIYKAQTTWSLMYDLDISKPLAVLCDPQRPWRNRPLFLLTGVEV